MIRADLFYPLSREVSSEYVTFVRVERASCDRSSELAPGTLTNFHFTGFLRT